MIFFVCWVIQTIAGWVEFSALEAQHGAAPELFGSDGYVWPWLQATMENWTSEYLQLFSFVTLTAYLIHRGSPESKDGDERRAPAVHGRRNRRTTGISRSVVSSYEP